MSAKLYEGDCLDILKTMPDNSIDSIVTDPPYGLSDHATDDVMACLTAWTQGQDYSHSKSGFMNRTWDSWVPGPEVWKECLRVLKPGGHLLAFSGTRSIDLSTIAIRLAGFEIRDQIGWLYGSGMPKGMNIGKAIDKHFGNEREIIDVVDPRSNYDGKIRKSSAINTNWRDAENRNDVRDLSKKIISKPSSEEAAQWEGWNTSLRPAWEPICVARKPLIGTVATNVLTHGTGGYNIDACRIEIDPDVDDPRLGGKGEWSTVGMAKNVYGDWAGENSRSSELGRFPTNVIHDGSDEVLESFAAFGEKKSGKPGIRNKPHQTNSMSGTLNMTGNVETGYADTGSVSRYFYSAKASKSDRLDSKHPTVKPIALMRYLCKLVTPKGGTVLDPFAGSGTTGQAAIDEGFNVILIEREAEYCADIRHRLVFFLDNNE